MTVTLVPSLPPTSDVPGNIGGVDTHKATHYAALIDNWSRLSWTDGFHPNTAGYATMAQVWSDAMKTPDLTPILMLLLDE